MLEQIVQAWYCTCRPLLHGLIQITSLIGTQRVESGHHEFAIKSAACQEPLGFFGVSSVRVLDEDLRVRSDSLISELKYTQCTSFNPFLNESHTPHLAFTRIFFRNQQR